MMKRSRLPMVLLAVLALAGGAWLSASARGAPAAPTPTPTASTPAAPAKAADAARWSWQQPHAAVDPKGDLAWKPQPFAFEAGASVRYVDFEGGKDDAAGTSKDAAWKHHPWDPAAAGKAKECKGVHTYVFKRGVTYRGALAANESGKPGDPIRLTSDPSWGKGEAVLAGSQKVGRWTKGAAHPDIPQPEGVWAADLDFAPRAVWIVDKAGAATRVPLARTPNWKVSNPDDVKSEWWHWDYKGEKPFDVFTTTSKGAKLHLGVDTAHLTKPAEYYKDAILWTEHAWVAGAPYPVRVEVVDTARKGLGFGGRFGGVGGSYKIVRFNRYFLEDKPHYLDDPEGEFWFDRKPKAAGGRLYLRPPAGADPNTLHVEAAEHSSLIDSAAMSHVRITGLVFRFTNPHWALDGVPYRQGKELEIACIRLLGAGTDLCVANCRFEHVQMAVRMKAVAKDDVIDRVVVADNDVQFTDRGAFDLCEGSPWGEKERNSGLLYDVKVLRNRLAQIGLRPLRFENGFAINLTNARTSEVAGNVVDRCYSGGINVNCGKRNSALRDVPLARTLIHHNKVTDSLLSNDDFGGIETWQGGPAYVYNNISGNPGGYRNQWLLSPKPGAARFGHAYYLDGAFKNFYFNNIAWGKSSDPASMLANKAAFQEIISYQNTFFNNTIYNFVKGTRRQAPEAGRNKYLGNVWQDISMNVFRHSDKLGVDPNAADAGPQAEHFAYPTNAFADNVFYRIGGVYGTFEAAGGDYRSLDGLKTAMAKRKALAADVGIDAAKPPLVAADKHDFRPAPGSAVRDRGARVFVPWALSGEVAEWNFYHAGDDPAVILDEHWTMTPYHVERHDYYKRPTYPLAAVNVTAKDYAAGPLEDWIAGTLVLNGKDQYAALSNAKATEPFVLADKGGKGAGDARTFAGEDLKSPQMHHSGPLIEVYFKTQPGHTGGVLVEKMGPAAGYGLTVNDKGGITFALKAGGTPATVAGPTKVNDGRWHHVIAEADRTAKTLTLYVDGRKDSSAAGPGADAALANDADLYVGGTPQGRCLAGAIDFARLARGTLADAKTTIEELYAWQFNGPFLRDFAGRPPAGPRRDAGALEMAN